MSAITRAWDAAGAVDVDSYVPDIRDCDSGDLGVWNVIDRIVRELIAAKGGGATTLYVSIDLRDPSVQVNEPAMLSWFDEHGANTAVEDRPSLVWHREQSTYTYDGPPEQWVERKVMIDGVTVTYSGKVKP